MPRKPDLALVTTDTQIAPAVQMSSAQGQTDSKFTRLSDDDKITIAVLASDKRSQVEIAEHIGCSQSTVSDFLKRITAKADAAKMLLKSHELEAVGHWAKAAAVASERGDHRPARELIEAANPELRPQQGNSARGVGVTINIGQPGQPLELPSISLEATFAPALSPASTNGDAS